MMVQLDTIYQNMRFIEIGHQTHLYFWRGDIYKMDVRQMTDFHKKRHAAMTIAAIKMPLSVAFIYVH